MKIVVPPLRERTEDIRPLRAFFLRRHLPKSRKHITGVSQEAIAVLKQHGFSGNVRELENIIERAIILENGSRVLHLGIVEPRPIWPIDDMVADYARQVVRLLGGNRTKAAEELGISPTSPWKILKEEGR